MPTDIESIVAELVESRVRKFVKAALEITDDHPWSEIEKVLDERIKSLMNQEIQRHDETIRETCRKSLDEFLDKHEVRMSFGRDVYLSFREKKPEEPSE